MISYILKKATGEWLKCYERKELVPNVRVIYIGDYVSRKVLVNGCYDPLILDFYRNKLFPQIPHTSLALDIGANIGNHTVVIKQYFDRVIAFEPNPQTALLLRANTMGGGKKLVEVVEKGLSDIHGTKNLSISYNNVGISRIVNEDTKTSIEVETLDRLRSKLKLEKVGFVKIDVEGHEAKVLAGAQQLLKSQQPVIALELHSSGDLPRQVHDELLKSGYQYFWEITNSQTKAERFFSKRMFPQILRPKVKKVYPKRIEKIYPNHVSGQFIIASKLLTF